MEPGEMASPQKPVFSLAVVDPKWVRAYVSEPDLGRVHPGAKANISVDSFPDRQFEGWIGFISPVAEFTPKSIETEELRSSLVYEVRVFVKDPTDELRLGMPATVRLPLEPAGPPSAMIPGPARTRPGLTRRDTNDRPRGDRGSRSRCRGSRSRPPQDISPPDRNQVVQAPRWRVD